MVDSPPRAFGAPPIRGVIRPRPEDFFVDEVLGFEADGDGEHILLRVEKRNVNSDWLAGQLARFADIPKRDVGLAGLKDRHAVTRQSFTLGLAGKPEPDWQVLDLDDVTILAATPHRRKLRRGSLRGNRFRIVIRELQGDHDALIERLEQIRARGVPNYFGEQRFGNQGRNIEQALAMFRGRRVKDRNKRSIYLSAARSFLFNALVAQRVEEGRWDRIIAGDVMNLDGSNSVFLAEDVSDELIERLARFDIHPTAVLWGRGDLASRGLVREREAQLAADNPALATGLEKAGLQQARRALRLRVDDLRWQLLADEQALQVEFFLPAGGYATSVLREVVEYGARGE